MICTIELIKFQLTIAKAYLVLNYLIAIIITYVAGEFPIGDLIIADGDAFTTGEPETITLGLTLGLTLGMGATTVAAGAVAMGCGGVAGSPAALFPVFTKDWCPFPFPFFCDLSPCASRMCTDSTEVRNIWFFFSYRSLKMREKYISFFDIIVNFIIQKLKSIHTSLKKYTN